MAKKDSKSADKNAGGKSGKGKGGSDDKDAKDSKGSSSKGAQSINVRHILVSFLLPISTKKKQTRTESNLGAEGSTGLVTCTREFEIKKMKIKIN